MFPISFTPALGDAFTVARPSWPLLFTAQLAAHDYEQIVKDEGRLQLWSNILCQDEKSDAWQAANFLDSTPLISDLQSRDTSNKTLYLSICPSPSNRARRFSFTYRIAYPSGDFTWLGTFGQDGILILNQTHSDPFDMIHLHSEWTVGAVQHSRILHIKDTVNSLEVAIIDDLSDFRVCAVTPDRLAPHPRNVSLLFLIPLRQRYPLVLSPTYAVAASPGLSISLVEDQHLTISGSGSALLQVYDLQTDITTFAKSLINHTELVDWELLSTDTKRRSMTLASTRQEQPVYATTIPFWPLEHMDTNIYLNYKQLANLYMTHDVHEFALFLPQTNQLDVFNLENINDHDILIENGSTGGNFTISPIYRISTAGKDNSQLQRRWGIVVLSPHNKVSTPVLLTNDPIIHSAPLASHHFEPTTCFSPLTRASSETMLPSITSPASHAGKLSTKGANNVEELESLCTDDNAMLSLKAPNQPSTPHGIFSLFKSIFVSVKAVVRFLFKVFWESILPFGNYQPRQCPKMQECDDPRIELSTVNLPEIISQGSTPDAGNLSITSENRVQMTESTMPREEHGIIPQDIDGPNSTIPKVSDFPINDNLISDDLVLAAQTSSGEKIFYAELFGDEDFWQATARIIILPMPHDADTETMHPASQAPSFTEALQKAVKFPDGSSPQCVISRVNVFNHDSMAQRQQIEHGGKNICYLLEFHLDSTHDKTVKLISISSP